MQEPITDFVDSDLASHIDDAVTDEILRNFWLAPCWLKNT